MKHVLIVSTHLDMYDRIQNYLKTHSIPEAKYSYLLEYYGSTPPAIPTDVNFIAIDDLRNKEAISEAISKIKLWPTIDQVVSTDEYSLCLAANVRESLGLPGLSLNDSLKFRDKVIMKEALKDTSVRIPKVYSQEEVCSGNIYFPVVAKPRSYAGSKGVEIIKNQHELNEYLSLNSEIVLDHSPQFDEFSMNQIEFEEHIEGDIFHIDGLVYKGKMVFCSASRYIQTCLDFMRGVPMGSVREKSDQEQVKWNHFAQDVCTQMNVPDGAFHLEAFLTPEGERIFLEIGARPGGSLVVPVVERSFGFNLDLAHLQCCLGVEPLVKQTSKPYYGYFIYPKSFTEEKLIVRAVTPVARTQYHSLVSAKTPGIGDPASGSFSYVDNLGSFEFCSESGSEIESDILRLKSLYLVEFQVAM